MPNLTVKNRQSSSSCFLIDLLCFNLKAVPYINFDSQETSVLYKKGSSAHISSTGKLLFFSEAIGMDPHQRNPCLGYK